MTNINALPEELLAQIFRALREKGLPSLYPCLLTCKRWHSSAMPIFYRDTVLTNRNLEPFLRASLLENEKDEPAPHLSAIRTLTVTLDYPLEGPGTGWFKYAAIPCNAPKARVFNRHITLLVCAVACMTGLTCFSFVATHDGEANATNFKVSRWKLAKMVRHLPGSCEALEIVVCGMEEMGCGYRKGDEGGLCEELGRVLPRLKHLRLQVGHLCFDAFGTGAVSNGEGGKGEASSVMVPQNFEPHHAPSLETLVIDCHSHNFNHNDIEPTRVCTRYACFPRGSNPRPPYEHWPVKHSITQLLKTLVANNTYPSLRRLWLVDWNSADESRNSVIHRRDILADKTWVFPREHVRYGKYRVETPERLSAICGHEMTRELAAGRTWVVSTTGARVPAAWVGKRYVEKTLEELLEREQSGARWEITSHNIRPPFEMDGVVD